MHGVEGVGDVTFDALPKSQLTLADKFVKSEDIDNFVKSAKFSEGKLWNPITASSIDEIEARYIWAEQKAKYTDGMTINQGDIALQEGALINNLQNVVIDGGKFQYNVSATDLANEVIQNKKALADALLTSKTAVWSFFLALAFFHNVSTFTSALISRPSLVCV